MSTEQLMLGAMIYTSTVRPKQLKGPEGSISLSWHSGKGGWDERRYHQIPAARYHYGNGPG
jgi:hypothetical protein